ncbi:LysE/ArgO family amino acid transporter [Paenibacillus hunanensis]|uniref:LysE/ArgO family amino acid transporter n=1 Tax=Paenibacillus hunanensis TaxID=539262 RepID=UPI002A69D22A|nr:LysE/ArgO family amino acid transporter [Paenibacillus hunanensis]WPP40663.1 LysE/ArgO family amino acid transporter [Paenibacillus hunanensis]
MAGVIIHAFILALGLILPLGVQNVFIFQQGMVQRSWRAVLPVVITAGLCDTLLISVAVGGVSVIVLGLPGVKLVLMGAGVLFLIYMGWVTWKSAAVSSSHPSIVEPNKQIEGKEGSGGMVTAPMNARRQIGFALSVSLLNPHALLDTIGVIGTNSLRYEDGERWAFTLTCIIVSWLWFVILAVAGMTIGRLDQSGQWFRWLNRSSAVLIWGIALYICVGLYGELRAVIGF